MTVREEWRWTDERGVQRLVGTDELRAALASGRLSASTLVWRDGMTEWSPAASRPELQNAVSIGRAVQSRSSGEAGEADRSTPTGIMPAKTAAATKSAPAKPPALPTSQPASLRAEAPLPPNRMATRTLLGIPAPHSERVAAMPTTGAPADQERRPGVTVIPKGGVPPEGNAVVPKAAAVPAVSSEAPRPQRKLTTREIDGGWGSSPQVEEVSGSPPAGRAPLPSFDLPLVDEGPKAAPAKATSASAARPPLPATTTKKAGSGVEAAPDRVTGPTLPSRTASVPTVATVAAKQASPKAEKAAEEKPAATRTQPPPAPRLGSVRPPAKQPPPLPGRQVTATLVAATTTPERAPVEASPAPAVEPARPAAASAVEPMNGARVELREPVRASPVLPPADDPLHLPPQRSAAPHQGANGTAAQPTGRSHSPLPPAPATHDGGSFPLPPGMPRVAAELDPAVPVHLSEPPPALPSEPPPASFS
ncbi:MAG: GYF domain-containing protein, partial [Minicystis sp.]